MNKLLVKNKFFFIIFIIYAIISIRRVAYADNTLALKTITYNDKNFNLYPECIRYHIKANGYNNKFGDELDNNMYVYAKPGPGRDLQTERAKATGYGNYAMRPDTSLLAFINFCYAVAPSITVYCSDYDANNKKSDYSQLCAYSAKTLNSNSKIFIGAFWDKMQSTLGDDFDRKQDVFFFEKYTNKGIVLAFNDLQELNDIRNNENNGSKEFITAMTSYMFSMYKDAKPNFTCKKGNVVPFLYVKEHVDSDCEEDGYKVKTNPRALAKYAYIAIINGWTECSANELWEEEYEQLFGEYIEDDLIEDIETLSQWYSETQEKYINEKGEEGNALLGANIDTIIQSDYSIADQVEAVDYYLKNEVGIANYKENMARNELMVKYMMEKGENSIKDIIKDYNVGIKFIKDHLQRGTSEEKNTNTVILSDLQKLEFDHTLANANDDCDFDSIPDKDELGNENEWLDMTGPMKRTYMSEHSGSLDGFDEEMEKVFVRSGGNREQGIVGHFDYKDGKCLYKVRDYNSNPFLIDTDFDGLNDNADNDKTDGHFRGNTGQVGNIDYTNDFRWFFTNNNKYNDELAVMSFIMSNLADGHSLSTDQVTGNMTNYMADLGFSRNIKNQFKVTDNGSIRGKLYMGKKTIQVGSNSKSKRAYKDVYGIFLGDFDSVDNYRFLLTNSDSEKVKSYYNHIVEDAVNCINTNKPSTTYDYCYWVCGYGIAGGIAAEVAAKLKEGGGEVFCYTFGATNAGSSTGANSEIMNIINEDDLIPKIYNQDEGFARAGTKYNDSIYDNLIKEYNKIYKNRIAYEANYKTANTLKDKISSVRSNTDINYRTIIEQAEAKILCNYTYMNEEFIFAVDKPLFTSFNNAITKIRQGHEKKSYYLLAKTLDGFDINKTSVNWGDEEERESDEVWSFDEFPCYQKKVGIPINNEVPMYFQTNERWSKFRYGRDSTYTDSKNETDNRVMKRESSYSYGTFYESSCGACAPAMVLSYIHKKYITPMDVRNRLEDEKIIYRDGSGTAHSVLTNDIPNIFNVDCDGGMLINDYRERNIVINNVKSVLKALIEGTPVIALCLGNNKNTNYSSYFTTSGHYIVLAGVNKEDIQDINIDDINTMTDDELNNIRIYVCDSAYYHHRKASSRTCTKAYHFSDFIDKQKAGVYSFWIYKKNGAYDNDEQWQYNNKSYTETFDPQTYIEYTQNGNVTIDNPYGTYKWEEPSWEYLE